MPGRAYALLIFTPNSLVLAIRRERRIYVLSCVVPCVGRGWGDDGDPGPWAVRQSAWNVRSHWRVRLFGSGLWTGIEYVLYVDTNPNWFACFHLTLECICIYVCLYGFI